MERLFVLDGRIIPAYAGCTDDGGHCVAGQWDHPRIRGVHSLTYPVEPPVKGSSPHTRGALVKARDGAAEAGIIPAYAGCTAPTGTPAQPTSDHPRIRGVHLHAGADSTPATGSSPHTRGALHRRDVTEIRGGIIPAYAGCTGMLLPFVVGGWDHPRIRGVHMRTRMRSGIRTGSSPHTRGALMRVAVGSMRLRIIPAYAGCT